MNEQFKVAHPNEDVFKKLQNLHEAGNHASAVEHGKQILNNFANSFLIQNIVASSLMHLDQIQEAKVHLQKALNTNPHFDEALINMGICLKKEGKARTALKFFQKARDANPSSIFPLKHLIQHSIDNERWPAAILHLKLARKLDSEDRFIFVNLLVVAIELGKFEAFDRELKVDNLWQLVSKNDLIRLYVLLLKRNQACRAKTLATKYKQDRGNDYLVPALNGLLAFYEKDYPTAISMIKRALRHDNQNITLLNHLCDAFIGNGEKIEALKYFRKLNKIDPNNHEAFHKSATLELTLGMVDEARESAENSLRLYPGHLPSQLILIDCDMAQDQFAPARRRAEKIVEDEALIQRAKQTLGLCLHESGDSQSAKKILSSCIAQYRNEANDSNNLNEANAYNNIHVVLKGLDEIEEAEAALLKAIELNPKETMLFHNLAQLYMEQGKIERGKSVLKEALEADLKKGIIRGPNVNLYVSAGRIDENDNIIKKLQSLETSQDSHLDIETQAAIKIALSKVYEDLGEIDKCFHKLVEGNALQKNIHEYNCDQDKQRLDAVFKLHEDSSGKAPFFNIGKYAQNPIFIVGMPRSGTTLIEKILGKHSEITAFGELDLFYNVISRLGLMPNNIQFDSLVEYYEHMGREIFRNLPKFSTPWFTDKTPANYRFIGLLKNAIPDAKFIYCFRSPEAVCWSNFKQPFIAKGLSFSFDLDDIVENYNLHSYYMNKWFELLGEDIIICDYSTLVDNTEVYLRSLTNQLGLDWEDTLLSHDEGKAKSLARTASMVQVSKGIYKGSDLSWKKFEEHLNPYFKKLVVPEFINNQ